MKNKSKIDILKKYGLIKSIQLQIRIWKIQWVHKCHHKTIGVPLYEFNRVSADISYDPLVIINKFTELNNDLLSSYILEYREIESELQKRYREKKLNYPVNWALETNSSLLVYLIVRFRKPLAIVETGVANGHSTYFILKAISRNKTGHLYSFDISPDVGILLNSEEKENWTLHILKKNYRKTFSDSISKIGKIDMFLHDSDHSYKWQTFEYQTLLQYMSSHSIFISDDVDSSYAFIDFSNKYSFHPYFLIDSRKVLGLIEIR